MDIEVGSDEGSWNNMTACRALALSLTQIFKDDGKRVHNILCLGGVHFDPNYAEAVFTEWGDMAGNRRASVIFANHYLIAHGGGFLVIPEKEVPEFKRLLVKYYEGEDVSIIAAFMKERCWKTM